MSETVHMPDHDAVSRFGRREPAAKKKRQKFKFNKRKQYTCDVFSPYLSVSCVRAVTAT